MGDFVVSPAFKFHESQQKQDAVIYVRIVFQKEFYPKTEAWRQCMHFLDSATAFACTFHRIELIMSNEKKSLALFTLNLNQESDSKSTENPMASISTR